MTGREKTRYACQSCGFTSPKWLGKCPDCGLWNSLAEEGPAPGETLALTAPSDRHGT